MDYKKIRNELRKMGAERIRRMDIYARDEEGIWEFVGSMSELSDSLLSQCR